jgi:hypothetical protein
MPKGIYKRKSILLRLMSGIDVQSHAPAGLATPCWLWTGSTTGRGYGQCYGLGETRAHRLSYRLFKGEIGPSDYVCHRCDIPQCVNPEHLWLGSPLDNKLDCVAKDRHVKGSRNKASKITEITAAIILQRYKPRCRVNGMNALAKEFEVSTQLIDLLVRRKTWKHVNPYNEQTK